MIVNVCGAGSSGTSLLATLLDRHPQIACGDELYLFNKPLLYRDFSRLRRLRALFRAQGLSASPHHPDRTLFHNLAGYGLDAERVWRWVADSADLRALAARFHAHIRERTDKPVWAEKTPSNSRTAPSFVAHFPNARVIHLIRDPRDQAISRMRRGSDLQTAAWIWLSAVAAVQPLRGNPRLLEIRYEDLVTDLSAQVARICAFLDLPCELDWFQSSCHSSRALGRAAGHSCWQMHPGMAPSPASIGRYRTTAETFAPLLNARLSSDYAAVLGTARFSVRELMTQYGYTADRSSAGAGRQQIFRPRDPAGAFTRRLYGLLDGDRPNAAIHI